MKPLVSVIIPTYKGQQKLGRAIKSIQKQTYDNIEIIVVDDNDPNTIEINENEEIIKKMSLSNLTYVQHEKNQNGAAARNTGIAVAQGDYVCFLDDDDIYLPTRIEESVNKLEGNLKSGAVFCNVLQLFSGDKCSVHRMEEESLTVEGILLYEAAIGTGSNLFLRTDIARKMGGFDAGFLRHQDLEFSIRLFEICPVCIIDKVLIVKAYNGANNVPQYERMKLVKEKYNRKFRREIENLGQAQKELYYINCYKSLYLSALYAENYSEAVLNLKKMQQYGFIPGIKQCILLILAFFHLYHRIKRIVERENGPKKSRASVISLNQIDPEILENIE